MTGSDSLGSTHLTLTRRAGRTGISILSARFDAAVVTGLAGGAGTVFGTLVLGAVVVGRLGLAAPIAGVAGIIGAGGGSWISMRGFWRRLARRYSERTTTLGESLAEAAQRAVEDGRVVDHPPT